MRKLIFIVIFPFLFSGCSIYSQRAINPVYSNIGSFLHYYEGIQNRLYGNLGNAVNNFKSALELEPENDAIYYELGSCYNMLNMPDSAIHCLAQAVQINPNNKHYRNLYGALLINLAKFDEALQNQIHLVKIDSLNVNYRFQLVLLYSQLKEFDNALKELHRIENEVGYNTRLAEVKLRIYLQNNDINNALAEANSIIKIEPDNPLYYIYKSEIYFKLGEDSLALTILENAANLNPLSPQVNIQLYQRYMQLGNYKEAFTKLVPLLADTLIGPDEKVQLFYPLLFEQKLYADYAQQLDSLVSTLNTQYPDNIFVYELLYEHYIRRQKLTKAREVLQILTLIEDTNYKRWEKFISFDYSTQNFDSVISNSSKAANLFPKQSIFYILKALVLDELGRTSEAIEVLKNNVNNIQKSEDKAEMLCVLGDYYYKENVFRKAFLTYEKALKCNPNSTRVLNNYSYYLALQNFRLKKALQMSSKAVDLDPNNPTFIDTKGWVLFKLGRYQEARDVLRNAIANSSNPSAEINEHYGDALFMTGNKQNAYIYWKKAQTLSGGSEKLNKKIRTQEYVP